MSETILIKNASQVVTVKGYSEKPATREEMANLSIIENGAVLLYGGKIAAVGTEEEVAAAAGGRLDGADIIDASGKIVLPGLVDPHTHLVHAGSREDEFGMRLKGATYMEIMESGGGIHATTSRTRAASAEELFFEGMKRLDSFLLHGVTTVEAKSGYGLDWETEYKQLVVSKKLNEAHAADVVSTFMGAHAVPAEFKSDPDRFIDLIIEEMLPKVAEEGLAEFNDVFCERGVFTPEQSRRLLEAGKRFGLTPKIHADEIEPYEGAELAAEVGAISADHLLKASQTGIERMAEKSVIGVLLPGTAFFLMAESANGRKMIDSGVAVALSTDCNPGSSPTVSMPLIMNLACLKMGMSPEEVITAATINAAHAIGRAGKVGSIETGKQADILIANVPNYKKLQYNYGMNHTDTVIKKGKIVVRDGVLC
ncbi:imidazolonepropionase [Neobacillus piezotolerans]|uniref:Imidazolonepropionase n=1 Tax=Neobacillus piezotolerans TaxID=2259171 RepID=A0A3D8GPT3_9BACI|nr:imidazolonepropionase [Neobacillus piezotolerans]RDU36503.1 imidazolonepropionase [Neobacillus piezotolerans]